MGRFDLSSLEEDIKKEAKESKTWLIKEEFSWCQKSKEIPLKEVDRYINTIH